MISIFSASKDLNDRWLGNRWLNDRGLHAARMRAADIANEMRRRGRTGSTDAETLRRDGCVEIRDFLPPERFDALSREVEATVARVAEQSPLGPSHDEGFGKPKHFPWGFDRADGGTINRFINIDPATMPETARAAADERLSSLSKAAVGLPFPASKVSIYITRHGRQVDAHDDQKDMHRDTFHASVKFWYFLRPVKLEQGPFIFVPGTHRLDAKRLAWENSEAQRIVRWRRGTRFGAFRIDEDKLHDLDMAKPRVFEVPANTLVLADTLGFHRRGDAVDGAERLSLYGSLRPFPFAPIGR
ncbi:phytanoyl-CoA dioxygenase family protein [Halovulum sp. GXIMD14794]